MVRNQQNKTLGLDTIEPLFMTAVVVVDATETTAVRVRLSFTEHGGACNAPLEHSGPAHITDSSPQISHAAMSSTSCVRLSSIFTIACSTATPHLTALLPRAPHLAAYACYGINHKKIYNIF
jgi:hypothetical protein